MARLKSPSELDALRKDILAKRDPNKPCITLCAGTGCQASGCENVGLVFEEELKKQELEAKIDLKKTGCHGFCEQGPLVVIYPQEICYAKVKASDVAEIVSQTILEDKVVDRLLYVDPMTGERIARESEIPFYKNQTRLIFGNNSKIDPTDIEDYIALDGYSALAKVLFEMTPEEVIEEVKKAKLRGRGGGGFPAGRKWEECRNAPGDIRYVIVNADEGDPGAFMDRAVLEGNPHSVLEGLIIGAYAIGAQLGYIYVRQEYPLAVGNVKIAIEQAEELGFLGPSILGSGFAFGIKIHRGAGAFVSGESSALMTALEGIVG